MKRSKRHILVVGSDSFIGSAFIAQARRQGMNVSGTTRRLDRVSKINLFLDFSNPESWQCPEYIDTALICAGITRLTVCENHPIDTKFVNVDGIYSVVKKLIRNNISIIFLSTNQVFDGTKPFRNQDDPFSPVTEYGRQKVLLEKKLTSLDERITILRLTKVLGDKPPLFQQWMKDLKNQHPITPYSNMRFSPVPIHYVVEILLNIITKKKYGIIQISGEKDISYTEVALICAKEINANLKLVHPMETTDVATMGIKHTTLNINRLIDLFSIYPPLVDQTIRQSIDKLK